MRNEQVKVRAYIEISLQLVSVFIFGVNVRYNGYCQLIVASTMCRTDIGLSFVSRFCSSAVLCSIETNREAGSGQECRTEVLRKESNINFTLSDSDARNILLRVYADANLRHTQEFAATQLTNKWRSHSNVDES